MELLIIIISSLYAVTGIIAIIGYYPTIRDLVKKKKSANVPSYIIWTLTSLVSFLYASIVIKDLLLIIVTCLGFISCFTILLLALRIK